MTLNLDCPRCRRTLAVSAKEAGTYANCPHCNGRLWVPEPEPPPAPGAESSPPAASSPPVPSPGDVAPPPPGDAAPSPPVQPSISSPPPPPSARAHESPPPPPRKVARLISAEAAQSPLKPSADGKLPELQLEDEGKKGKADVNPRAVNPLVLAGLLTLSIVASVMLVLWDVDKSGESASKQKAAARRIIETEYITSQEQQINPEAPLKPYQRILREALRTADADARRAKYREVLKMLRAETLHVDDPPLTGGAWRDERLIEQITILLSED